jgi:hypothetical protein
LRTVGTDDHEQERRDEKHGEADRALEERRGSPRENSIARRNSSISGRG